MLPLCSPCSWLVTPLPTAGRMADRLATPSASLSFGSVQQLLHTLLCY